MVSKRRANRPANIYGNAVSSITPSSDWFVSRRCSRMTVLANYLPSGHVLGTGKSIFKRAYSLFVVFFSLFIYHLEMCTLCSCYPFLEIHSIAT